MTISISICNDALNHLGAEYITSLSEESKTARVCAHQYPIARDTTLRSYVWNFALKRALITPTGNTPVWGEAIPFNIPADCVRINKVLVEGNPAKFKVEGRHVYCVADTIMLSYVSSTASEGLYDVAFNKAVSARLAADMCFNITQSNNLQKDLYALSEQFAKDARSSDSMENTPEDFTFSYFDDSRRVGHEIYPESIVF